MSIWHMNSAGYKDIADRKVNVLWVTLEKQVLDIIIASQKYMVAFYDNWKEELKDLIITERDYEADTFIIFLTVCVLVEIAGQSFILVMLLSKPRCIRVMTILVRPTAVCLPLNDRNVEYVCTEGRINFFHSMPLCFSLVIHWKSL